MSKVFHQVFFLILLIVFTIFAMVYFYSVPLIKQKVFEIEQASSRTALNNIYELANRMHTSLEDYKQQALETRKQQLKIAVSFTETFLRASFNESAAAGMTREEAREKAFAIVQEFKFGDDEYVWIADFNSVLVSHPDPHFRHSDVSYVTGNDGDRLFTDLFRHASTQQEGFYQYAWKRPGEAHAADKVAYMHSYPEWQLVIGSGVYLDNVEREVQRRSREAMTDLRDALKETRVANTGYFFVFDSKTKMLIHPNANIEGTIIEQLPNPVTNNSIATELINSADTGQELYYKWDKPSDPGNYVYDKLSLVRYMPGLDWYISSSIYVEELQQSAELLSKRILTIAIISLMMLSIIAYVLLRRITQPIAQLADTARQIRKGDLTAQSGIRRRDEIGLLADSFDAMIGRLKTNIDTLDLQVQERTQALAATEERLRLILDALPAQISYCDTNSRYLFVNKAYADQFGQDQDSIVGKHFRDVLGESMYADISERLNRVLAGESVTYEYSFNHNNKVIITKRQLIPEFDDRQQVIGILNLSLDVTAEKEAQRQLNEAQRMTAVGQLAGGMAHDFNNLLSIILGNLLLAKSHHHQVTGLAEYLDPAINASRRGADITHRMLAFSRRQSLFPAVVNVNQLIDETRQLLRGSLPSNIQIHFEQQNEDCLSFVDSSHLENALVNLALNAKDAMPDGGKLQFTVSGCTIAHTTGSAVIYDEAVPAGNYIRITIADTGKGFDSHQQQQAFEPFFTTKNGDNHSGLGLSMVYGFVKQSGGYIHIDSAPEQGAAISLLLPVAIKPTSPESIAAPGQEIPAGIFKDKLMLLVEDNHQVRRVVREQLTELGINVVEAEDADEAQMLISNIGALDGLVSDIVLRDSIDGFELARTFQQQQPQGLVLLISGYSHESSQQPGDRQELTLLRKPFDQQQLLSALSQAAHHCLQTNNNNN